MNGFRPMYAVCAKENENIINLNFDDIFICAQTCRLSYDEA